MNKLPPIACSLPLRDAASQVVEWYDLNVSRVSSEQLDQGWRITYPAELSGQVADLVARESRCCSWLTLKTETTEEGIVVELESDHPDAGPVLALLAGTA